MLYLQNAVQSGYISLGGSVEQVQSQVGWSGPPPHYEINYSQLLLAAKVLLYPQNQVSYNFIFPVQLQKGPSLANVTTATIGQLLLNLGSRDSVVGTVTSYGLDDRGVGVRVLVGFRIFSFPNRPDRL
jgi:hypothetical protein